METQSRSLIILYSFHHKNTEKIAQVFARVFDAVIKTPQNVKPGEPQEYDLVGFGSGIYGAQHHAFLLNLADKMPVVTDRKAFLFSTSTNLEPQSKTHSLLREKLVSKNYTIVDEFTCAGFNTNSFIKYVGGLNRGRPNLKDLQRAEEFALNLKQILAS